MGKPKYSETMKNVLCAFTPDQHEQGKLAAAAMGITFSELVRIGVDWMIEHTEATEPEMALYKLLLDTQPGE